MLRLIAVNWAMEIYYNLEHVINMEIATICEFEVEVQDKAAPVIDCGPPGVTVLSCNAFPGFNPGSYAPTSDNCGSTVISWTIQNQMNCNFEGDYIVTYTATDIAGNTASCSKTLPVSQYQSP